MHRFFHSRKRMTESAEQTAVSEWGALFLLAVYISYLCSGPILRIKSFSPQQERLAPYLFVIQYFRLLSQLVSQVGRSLRPFACSFVPSLNGSCLDTKYETRKDSAGDKTGTADIVILHEISPCRIPPQSATFGRGLFFFVCRKEAFRES